MNEWRQLELPDSGPKAPDPRRRLGGLLAGFVVLLVIVLGRAVMLEVSYGEKYRQRAAHYRTREVSQPAQRGRIVARDGTLLAADQQVAALALHYRWIEEPPDQQWLRATAQSRLNRAERARPERVTDEMRAVLQQRRRLHQELAETCGLSTRQWQYRIERIQTRVESIARRVNEHRLRQWQSTQQAPTTRQDVTNQNDDGDWWTRIRDVVADALTGQDDSLPPPPIVVAEQVDYHVVVEVLPDEAAARIRSQPERFPGVRIEQAVRRAYPAGTLAAHLVGHVGPVDAEELDTGYQADDVIGRMGIELAMQQQLGGQSGQAVQRIDSRGRTLDERIQSPPQAGQSVMLTIDPPLQRAVEALLDSALQRRRSDAESDVPAAGGAIVVLDVRDGAVLAAASAPRFDPNLFTLRIADQAAVQALLTDPSHPLVDRTTKMAIPPGSVFKVITAAALLEAGVPPDEPLTCQGYLNDPRHWRCQIYRHRGIGHGPTDLADALAQSCNVYFFHHAAAVGPDSLADWAGRFGLGRPTGCGLPDEAAGNIPTPQSDRWTDADTLATAIGQGKLTATPLQIARMTAAIANGGYLVQPHLVKGHAAAGDAEFQMLRIATPRRIAGLDDAALAAIRAGLERVVSDPDGTAYATMRLDSVTVAGKTGTAETGGGRPDHAWFAGYLPADRPQYVLVVALEHAGGGGSAAGPVARRAAQRIVERLLTP